jgi:hypothetical protein
MPELPRPTWAEFSRAFRNRWEQGEHVFINGQTGSGKTDLLLRIMDMRTYSVVYVTKPRDAIFKSPLARPYRKVKAFPSVPRVTDRRLMLSDKQGDSAADMVGNQHAIFKHANDTIFHRGGYAVGVDESLWISNRLKLGAQLGDLSFLGRALGISVVSATQRPAHIPVIVPQSASHAFISKTGRKGDLQTLAELGGDTRATMEAIASLRDKHDFLYVDCDGRMPLQIVNTHR